MICCRSFFAALFILLFGATLEAAVTASRLNYRITIPDKSTREERAAASLLNKYMAQIFTKPVRVNGKVPRCLILEVSGTKSLKTPGAEFCISLSGDKVSLGGIDRQGEGQGTELAAAYFLRKYVGVKVYYPGKEGIHLVKDPELRLPAKPDMPVPVFSFRSFSSAAKGISPADMREYRTFTLCHTPSWVQYQYYYHFLGTWKKRFQEHPEYFALHEGRRVYGSYPFHFPCTSNPEVLKLVVNDLQSAIRKNPRIRAIRLFCDAPVKGCECSNCAKSSFGRAKGKDSSEVVYSFFCRIAREVQKSYPHIAFHTQTKGTSYSIPPKSETLPPGSVVQILSGHFGDPDYREMANLCRLWQKAGARTVVFSYPRAPEMKNYPLMNARRVGAHIKALKGLCAGTRSSENKGSVPWSFSALNMFVQSSMLWNPDQKVEDAIQEFCSAAAPGAEKELGAFYEEMENVLKGAAFRADPKYNCYVYPRLTKAEKLLRKAQEKASCRKFLDPLAKDFSAFLAEMKKVMSAYKAWQKLMDEYESTGSQRENIVLEGQEPKSFPLYPLAVYDDFQAGSVEFCRKGNSLCLRIRCQEKMLKSLQKSCRESRTGQVWNDDVVEIFLAPAGKTLPYWHLAVNPKGVYRFQFNAAQEKGVEELNWQLVPSAFEEKNAWVVECAIPLRLLKSAGSSDREFSLGVFRSRPGTGGRGAQLSGIRVVKKGFHDPAGRICVSFR